MNKKKPSIGRYILLLIFLLSLYSSWSLFIRENFKVSSDSDTERNIEIGDDSEIEDIILILKEIGDLKDVWSFKIMSKLKRYDSNIKGGIVTLKEGYTNNELINSLRRPERRVMYIQIPENVRLIEDMIVLLEDSAGFNRGELQSFLDTSSFLEDNNLTIETLPAFLIPNTYQIYDGLSVELFLDRMKREYDIFWDNFRLSLCDSVGLTPVEVSILASIVEEEQDKRIDERPKIAGLYLNRLNNPLSFPYLQADPTVKFANKDFTIKQVLNKHLKFDNSYNTYKYKGLPPGPICIPSINAIDAVLNCEKHDYYFMCAGSNGDGYHKFTSSNKEHNKNKGKYKKYQGLN